MKYKIDYLHKSRTLKSITGMILILFTMIAYNGCSYKPKNKDVSKSTISSNEDANNTQKPNETSSEQPSKYSQHSKGIAADITLSDKNGNEISMPTKFDNFTEKAHAYYKNLPCEVISNRDYLTNVMEQHGFEVNTFEW